MSRTRNLPAACAFFLIVTIVTAVHAQVEGDDFGAGELVDPLTSAWPDVQPVALQQPALNIQPSPVRPPIPVAPRRQPSLFAARRPVGASGLLGLASVPFMIGDTAGGSCASVRFLGALDADIQHPTLGCSRLNISENNSALLRDRVYLSYRHFHNVSETKVFQFENDLSIDRFTFGLEKTFREGLFSAEVRVPLARELASTLEMNGFDSLPLDDRDGEFGNIAVVLKALLLERPNFVMSAGVAVTAPTADDVIVNGDFFDFFEIIEPSVLFAFADVDFGVTVENETVNISPFLAWLWAPNDRWFSQGFLQLDVAANPSDLRITGDGTIFPFTTPPLVLLPQIPVAVDEEGEFFQQTLMRLNVGVGRWLYLDPYQRYLKSLAAMFEVNYTTTLQDANLFETELFAFDFMGATLPADLAIGNGLNRVDIVNFSFGLAAQVGQTQIVNGFVVPISRACEKAFDFEYNLQVQRLF